MFIKLTHNVMEYLDEETDEPVLIRNRKKMHVYKPRVRSVETVLVRISGIRLIVADLNGQTMIHYDSDTYSTMVNETPDQIYKLIRKENDQWILT